MICGIHVILSSKITQSYLILLVTVNIEPAITKFNEIDPELDHNFSGVLCTHYGELHQTKKE